MDSFYSGTPAASFIISAIFPSLQEAITECRKGSSYTDVWYNEYLLIDTPNKNDRHNGQIYKRGLNFQNNMGGLIYIGQIVGPSGGTPYIAVDSVEQTQKYGSTELPDEYSYRRFPTGKNDDGTYVIAGEDDYTEEQPSGTPAIFDLDENGNHGIRPGKYYDEDGTAHYNDSIQYTWVNIRLDNNTSDSWFYVGFSYPYDVIEYDIHTNSPYDEEGFRKRGMGGGKNDPTTIERTDDKTHPYYERWNLGIPRGIKGDALRNLRVIVPTADDVIYSFDAITLKTDGSGEIELGKAGYDGQEDDIAVGRQIVVFDYYKYDDEQNPDPIMIYLGDFNIITQVLLDEDGTLRLNYTHNDQTHFDKKIQWITNITLTTGNGVGGGHFKIEYNNYDKALGTGLPREYDIFWIRGIYVNPNGDVDYTFVGTPDSAAIPTGSSKIAEGVYRVPHQVRWENDVSLDTNNGTYRVTYNTDKNNDGQVDYYETILDWVKDITINEKNGEITVHHTADPQARVSTTAKLKIVTQAVLSDDGVITLTFNTGDTLNLKVPGAPNIDQHLKWIKSVKLSDKIEEDKRITVNYNTGNPDVLDGPINYVQYVIVNPNDFHLFMLYSDPSSRATVQSDGTIVPPQNSGTVASDWKTGTYISSFLPNSDTTKIPRTWLAPAITWQDMGPIKDDHGVLIGLNIDDTWTLPADIAISDTVTVPAGTTLGDAREQGATVVQYLNSKYPTGITNDSTDKNGTRMGAAVRQKIVTYSRNSTNEENKREDKEFYAYDYSKPTNGWYFLGTLSDTGVRDVKLLTKEQVDSETAATYLNTLSTQGLVFEVISTQQNDTDMPQFWSPAYNDWV